MAVVEFFGKALAWIFGITGLIANIAIITLIISVRKGASLYLGYHNFDEEDEV